MPVTFPELRYSTCRDIPASPARLAADALANILFPVDCLACGDPVWRHRDRCVCDRCWGRVLELRCSHPMCPSCGLPYRQFGEGSGHLCGRCILNPPPFSGARSYGYYRSELRSILHSLKFGGIRNLTDLLSPLAASTFSDCWRTERVDWIVPVPLHPDRERERGFNQSALLARGVSDLSGIPLLKDALRRARRTVPQTGLSEKRRERNVRNAFRSYESEKLKGARVLLVDDVMTTGATVASATAELKKAGALRVWVLTVARAVPGPDS